MWPYIFLGILQGIFEWIPISSEGVVALVSGFLKLKANLIDTALFLHLGTLFAALFYFRKDWKEVLTLKNPRLMRFLIFSTLVSLAIGYPVYKLISNTIVGSGLLIIMGVGLLFTAFFQKTKKPLLLNFDQLALAAGFLQGLAVIPGLSRSGGTIFGLSLSKLTPTHILKISYLMSAPVVLVSSAYLFLKNPNLTFIGWPGLVSSFLVGLLSLHFLISWSQKINFFRFALIFSLLCFLGAAIEFLL